MREGCEELFVFTEVLHSGWRLRTWVLTLFIYCCLLQQSAEVDECGGYRKHKYRGNQKKTSLQQQLCCLPIGDSQGASSQMRHSEQSTVMESFEAAGPSGWIDAPQLPRLLCSRVPEKGKETSLCKLVTKQKAPEKELDTGLIAATLHQTRRIVARRPSSTVDSSCAEPSSPSSQRSKRRKALAKLIPGQKVPRFQSTASSGLLNHLSKAPVVWIMKQNVCAWCPFQKHSFPHYSTTIDSVVSQAILDLPQLRGDLLVMSCCSNSLGIAD